MAETPTQQIPQEKLDWLATPIMEAVAFMAGERHSAQASALDLLDRLIALGAP